MSLNDLKEQDRFSVVETSIFRKSSYTTDSFHTDAGMTEYGEPTTHDMINGQVVTYPTT